MNTNELLALAIETFGTHEKANEWLVKSHPELQGQTPYERAGNKEGEEQVKAILLSLRYGG